MFDQVSAILTSPITLIFAGVACALATLMPLDLVRLSLAGVKSSENHFYSKHFLRISSKELMRVGLYYLLASLGVLIMLAMFASKAGGVWQGYAVLIAIAHVTAAVVFGKRVVYWTTSINTWSDEGIAIRRRIQV